MSNDTAAEILFRQIDVNGDGQLEKSELRAWLEAKGEETLANSLFDNLDTNSDGVVSLQEFVAGFEQTKLRKIAEDESKLLSSPETSPVLRAVSLQWLLEFVEQNKRKAFSWRNEREFMAPEDGGGEDAILEVKRGNSLERHRDKRRAAEKAKSGKQVVVSYTDIPFEYMYTSDVVACFVWPVAKSKNLSYAMAENLKIGAPTYFVSHAWGNHFNDLVHSVAAHLDGAVAKETFIWLDIFAINQNNAMAAMAELNVGGTGMTLRRTIEHARATVAVLDKERVVPLSRLWCLYELGSSPQEKLQLVTQGFDEKEIAARIEDIDASTALCFSEDDRKFIHGEIEKRFGGLDKFTRHLKLRFLLNPLDYEADMKVLRQRAKSETFRFDAIKKFFEDGGNVACIVGGAGEGKSTISATVLNGVSLDAAAVHICKDADVRRQDELRVIHSLAYQLAVRFEEVARSILGLKHRIVDDGIDKKTGKPINQRPALPEIQVSAKWAKNLLLIEPLESLLSSGRQDQSPPCLLMFDALDEGFTRNKEEEDDEYRHSSSKISNQKNPVLSLVCTLLKHFGKTKLQILVTTRPEPGHIIRDVEVTAKKSNLELKRFEPSELRDDDTSPAADIIIRPELQKAIANSKSKVFELVATRFAETYPDLAKSRPVPTNADEAYRQWFEAASPLPPETKRLLNVIFAAREPLTMLHIEQMGLHAEVSKLPGLGLLFEEREHKLHILHKSLGDFLRDANRAGKDLAVDTFSGDVEITRSCILIERQKRGGQMGSYAKEHCQDHFEAIVGQLNQMKITNPSLVLRPMVVSILDELGHTEYVRKELSKMEEALEQDVFISFVTKETASWARLIQYELADTKFSKLAKIVGGALMSSYFKEWDVSVDTTVGGTSSHHRDEFKMHHIRIHDFGKYFLHSMDGNGNPSLVAVQSGREFVQSGRKFTVQIPQASFLKKHDETVDKDLPLMVMPTDHKNNNVLGVRSVRSSSWWGCEDDGDKSHFEIFTQARLSSSGDLELDGPKHDLNASGIVASIESGVSALRPKYENDNDSMGWNGSQAYFSDNVYNYPVDVFGLTYWTDAVEKAILKCKVFVAILSPLYGVPRPNFQRDIANVQPQVIGRDDGNCWTSLELLCARALGKPIVFLCVDPPSKTSELWKKNVLGERDTWIQLPKYNDGLGVLSHEVEKALLEACEEICCRLSSDDDEEKEGERAQEKALCKYLLKNVNAKDGRTALMMSAAQGHAEIVSALLQAGADVNAKAKDGQTALVHAARKGDAEIVSALLQAGADVNAKAKDGQTALVHAARKGDAEIVSALLQAGADVNAKAKDGQTALVHAARKGDAEIVSALLQAGADVNAKAKDGQTALMLTDSDKCKELLRAAGATS
ncbi:EF-hand domain-containing protein [Pseudoscourfieldia marina]